MENRNHRRPAGSRSQRHPGVPGGCLQDSRPAGEWQHSAVSRPLRTHDVTLPGRSVELRPMTEGDWGFLRELNNDRDVLWYAEEDDGVTSWRLPDLQRAYRHIARTALMFIVERAGVGVGECWLQTMNRLPISDEFPGLDLRRIDVALASPVWGQGIGTETIGLLTAFGFDKEHADGISAVGVADYNERSRRAFERNGYQLHTTRHGDQGAKAAKYHDLVRWASRP